MSISPLMFRVLEQYHRIDRACRSSLSSRHDIVFYRWPPTSRALYCLFGRAPAPAPAPAPAAAAFGRPGIGC